MKRHFADLPSGARLGFTFVELMLSLIIFALVATAGTYLLASASNTQKYAQVNAASDSEIEFAKERITENIRAATAVTISGSTITITSPPSSLISGGTFTITYTVVNTVIGSNLTETYVTNATGATYSSGVLVHNVSQFSAAKLGVNPKAFQVTISTGSATSVQRTFMAFGRNL